MDTLEPQLPIHMETPMRRYIKEHIIPGAFLEAVLCNDLKMAVARADHVNRARLSEIVMWLIHKAPVEAWGSKKAYYKWTHQPDSEL